MDTILIIEDDADLREGLEYTLSGEGYQILTAENAERGRGGLSRRLKKELKNNSQFA